MLFPLLLLILNVGFRRTLRSRNRGLIAESLLLFGITLLPFSILRVALFVVYAVIFAFARFFFLRVGHCVDRFAIRYTRLQPHNSWEILARELSWRDIVFLSALLLAALLGGFMPPVFAPAWISLLFFVAVPVLLFRCPQYMLTPAFSAACEFFKSFSIPDKDKKLCHPERKPLPLCDEGNADAPDVLLIVCESLSKRILESEEGRKATPLYQEFLRKNSSQTHAFPLAIANSSTSDIAYVTLFSGLSPDASHQHFHRQPLVWSAARARGYHTSFYSSGNFCWLNMEPFLLDGTLDIAITSESMDTPCINDLSMDDRLLNRKILQDWDSHSRPRFCVVNYNMLHVPCLVPEETPATKKMAPYERYLLALGVFDQCFAELVQRLEKDGRLDRTAIAFTGDHGETPRTGGHIDPEQSPDRIYRFHPDNLRVPLWIRVPDRGIPPSASRRLSENRDKNVSNIDLYPTLLDLIGYPCGLIPVAPSGSSLCQPLPARRKIIALNANEFRAWDVEPFALLKKNHLFLYQDMNRRFELYDLQKPVTPDLWPQLAASKQKRWISEASRYPALRAILKKRGIRFDESAQMHQIADAYNKRGDETDSAALHELNNWHLFSAEEWEEFCLSTARTVGIKKGERVLEAGCGAGAFLDVLWRHYQITMEGVDLADDLIDIARKRLPGKFWTGDIQRMPFVPSRTYDKTLSHGIFSYLPTIGSIQNAALEMLRVTKPGGTVYIGVMNDPERTAHSEAAHPPDGNALVTRDFWVQFALENELKLEMFDQETIYQKSSGYDAHSRLRYSVCLHTPLE